MKDDNFYLINGFLFNKFQLNTLQAVVLAFIAGFEEGFTGSLQYIADSTGMHRNTAYKTLNQLIEKKLVKKTGTERQKCKYSVTREVTACYTRSNRTVTREVHNNNKYINTNNKYTKKSSFNDFEQRVYNFSELEKVLRSN